jgi:hypothetical protein
MNRANTLNRRQTWHVESREGKNLADAEVVVAMEAVTESQILAVKPLSFCVRHNNINYLWR